MSEKFTRFAVLWLVEVLLSCFGDQAAGEASIIISSCFFRREEIDLAEFFVSFCHMFSFVGLKGAFSSGRVAQAVATTGRWFRGC